MTAIRCFVCACISIILVFSLILMSSVTSASAQSKDVTDLEASDSAEKKAPILNLQRPDINAQEQVEEYNRKIRQAVSPKEIRLACSSPEGTVMIGEEIIICAESNSKFKFLTPSTADEDEPDPKEDAPTKKAERDMKSARDQAATGHKSSRTPLPGEKDCRGAASC